MNRTILKRRMNELLIQISGTCVITCLSIFPAISIIFSEFHYYSLFCIIRINYFSIIFHDLIISIMKCNPRKETNKAYSIKTAS